jgi:hypothetical protein
VLCPANKWRNLLALFAAGRVAPPHVGPATTRRRASPAPKSSVHISSFFHGAEHPRVALKVSEIDHFVAKADSPKRRFFHNILIYNGKRFGAQLDLIPI